MVSSNEQSLRLLQGDEIEESDHDSISHSKRWHHKDRLAHIFAGSTILQTFSLLSVLTNILLGALLLRPHSQFLQETTDPHARYEDVSPYAKLARHPSYRFPYTSGYGPLEATNHTLADEMWEAIDIDPGIIAVPLDWAEEHNLAETQVFPWDHTKGIYVVNAFHSVHCLKILHRLVYDAHHGRPLSREVEHAMHCIDHMRKDAMCNADDFLLPTPPRRQGDPGPRGQSRVCKDWDALVGWAKEHDACYRHITDDEAGFARDHQEIERYLNCKPESPYAQKVREYVDSKAGVA